MNFSLNEFLESVSSTLDFIEADLFGISTFHSNRIAYISLRIAKALKFSDPEIFDLISLAILHDNGATMSILEVKKKMTQRESRKLSERKKAHCLIGNQNVLDFPFQTETKNAILYHHENWDGSGFFGLTGEEIPIFSQIIHLADSIDLNYKLDETNHDEINSYVLKQSGHLFSPVIVEVFLHLNLEPVFWQSMLDEHLKQSLHSETPKMDTEYNLVEIRRITKTFSRIIDAKSKYTQKHSNNLALKMQKMATFYNLDNELVYQLLIAADLHDLGKLAISNVILDKAGPLTKEEFEVVQQHSYTAWLCLKDLTGFEKIASWILNHHEKLDGSGYPNESSAMDLDFESRLLTCLDIFQALSEHRPYRRKLESFEAINLLKSMAEAGKIDRQIVQDINQVFLIHAM